MTSVCVTAPSQRVIRRLAYSSYRYVTGTSEMPIHRDADASRFSELRISRVFVVDARIVAEEIALHRVLFVENVVHPGRHPPVVSFEAETQVGDLIGFRLERIAVGEIVRILSFTGDVRKPAALPVVLRAD